MIKEMQIPAVSHSPIRSTVALRSTIDATIAAIAAAILPAIMTANARIRRRVWR
jgi:hypothetical protein